MIMESSFLRMIFTMKRSANFMELLRITSRNLSNRNINSPKPEIVYENESHFINKPICWDEAKPYSQIPANVSIFQIIRYFLPRGKYNGEPIKEMLQTLTEKQPDIIKIRGILGKSDMIILFDPKDFEQVYRFEGPWPYRADLKVLNHFRRNVRPDVYGENAGVLVEQGEKWKELRSKINPVMMQPRVVKQYVTAVEEVADEFITRILQIRDSKNELPRNFIGELNKWSLESISRIALDTKLGCLQNNSKSNSDAQKMIRSVNDFFALTFKLEVIPPIWKYIRTPSFIKLRNALDTMINISLKKINEAIERINNNHKKHAEHEASVLEKLLQIDRNVAVVMAMDMFLAGVDTTSYSFAILLYFLSTNQRVQERLREEAFSILPEKHSKLTSESFNHVPYLRACMKEANRILPVAGGTRRKLPVDLVLSGYQVPKGSEVVLNHRAASMNTEQFPKPGEFIPERWLGRQNTSECPSAKSAHPFTFLPFGVGARGCIGKRFAELEIQTLITKLIRNHRVEWDCEELEIASKILTTPVSPLRFKVTGL